MSLSRRNILSTGCLGAAGLASIAGSAAIAAKVKPVISAPLPAIPQVNGKTLLTADESLARLKEGNRRFVADQPTQPDISSKRRMAIAQGQAPFAAILCCSDSRAGPEQLFGAGLGELFVVRTAGNYVDTAGMGSLEFGVASLGAPLIVVLGHERCGAVKAASAVVKENAKLPGSLGPMVEPIIPAVLQAKSVHKEGGDLVEEAGHANVRRVVARLRDADSPVIGNSIKSGKVKVVGAYYDLDTGTVDFFEV
jgi:carbonic anhydrase